MESSSYRQHQEKAHQGVRVAVLAVSDTRTEQDDVGGQTIQHRLEEAGHHVSRYKILKDEPQQIRQLLEQWLADSAVEAIITTGGTGVARRDGTVEVVDALLEKKLEGFGELFRMLSFEQVGSGAMLSRALGGTALGKLIFALPGSVAAVSLAMEKLIVPEIGHLVGHLRR